MASAHQVPGEYGAAEEGPSELFDWRSSVNGDLSSGYRRAMTLIIRPVFGFSARYE